MKIRACSLGIAAGSTFCAFYLAFGLILKYYPSQTLKFIGMIHMMPKLDYLQSFIRVTPQAILVGALFHGAVGFVLFGLIASIYNLFQK
jgi:hypothetical protein